MGVRGKVRAAGKYWLPVFPFALALVFAVAPSVAYAEEKADNVCVSCHMELDGVLKQVALDWQESAHGKAGVYCQECHGGNPYDISLAMEPSQGFKKKPSPGEIPQFCSKCHSDPVRMRSHNLKSDQFEKFRYSVHGRKLLEAKDNDAPSCVSCHGKHDIRKVDDPLSPVNRKNVVKTCASCHSDVKMMSKKGLPHNQYELYKGSVHGKAYFEKGDAGVPTCFNCHSNHGIQKPQTLGVRFVCADCHVEQADAYKKSRHWQAAQDTGKPLCINCHSNHDIQKPRLSKFTASGELNCLQCHQKNSIQMETGNALYESLSKAQNSLSNATYALRGIEEWSGSGFQTSGMKDKLGRAQKIYKEMKVGAHSLDAKASATQAQTVAALSKEVNEEIGRMLVELRNRKLGLIATWIVAVFFTSILWKRSKYCKRD